MWLQDGITFLKTNIIVKFHFQSVRPNDFDGEVEALAMSLDMWKRQAMDVKDRIKQAMMKHNDTNFDPSVSYSVAQTNWRHQDFNCRKSH